MGPIKRTVRLEEVDFEYQTVTFGGRSVESFEVTVSLAEMGESVRKQRFELTLTPLPDL